ncbi:MAG: hypothetical protein JW810_05800 [Sedimentisphaerales bacterium]|nr:hypothetical protein [Sedimentisphaerales bacterium]
MAGNRRIDRRDFLHTSLLSAAGGALSGSAGASLAANDTADPPGPGSSDLTIRPNAQGTLPAGTIGKLQISRILLGGNLLTHFTHSRDLRYVYTLAAHYNTVAKILETMALAESYGVNTLVIHTAAGVMEFLTRYRYRHGGKMQWIICPTAELDDSLDAYRGQVQQIVQQGVDAIYLWGVRSDQLVARGQIDLMRRAVDLVRDFEVPTGVGAHDLRVVEACEKNKVEPDFYIKTLHHHRYPSAPRPDQIRQVTSEVPGYWCRNPEEVMAFMKDVARPWIAFKVMAAGAIPPRDGFQYAFQSGADHIIAGMFDFEIAEDARIANEVLDKLEGRRRPWRS